MARTRCHCNPLQIEIECTGMVTNGGQKLSVPGGQL